MSPSSPYTPQELEELFALFDKQQRHKVERNDIGLMLRSLGIQCSDKKILDILDTLPSSDVNFVEFETLVHRKDILALRMGNMRRTVLDAFETLDPSKTGSVNTTELRHILTSIGEKLSDREFDEAARLLGFTGDRIQYGKIVDDKISDM